MKLAKILLESKREEHASIIIQKTVRGFICRKRYTELRKAAVVIQSGKYLFYRID